MAKGWTGPRAALIVASLGLSAVAALVDAAVTARAQGCDVELMLDAPADGAEVSAEQRIAGWAVDRAAAAGSGIQSVRIAFDVSPERASDAAFIPLPFGLPRADVARALGSGRYADAGFAQDWAAFSLAPGEHRVVVQAKSACGWSSLVRAVRLRSESGAIGDGPDALGPARSSEVQDAPLPLEGPAPTDPASSLTRVPPLPVYAPAPRFSLSAVPAGSSGVTLTWAPAPGASTYNVYLTEDGAPQTVLAPGAQRPLGLNGMLRVQSGVSGTTTQLAGLNAGTTYRFVVRAVNDSGGEGAESEMAQVTLPSQPPNALTATPSSGGIALSWSEVPGAVTYTLFVAPANRPLLPDPQRSSLTTTSTTIDRVGLGSYRFQVEARDAAGGRLARSNVAQVLVDPATLAGAAPPQPGAPPAIPPGAPPPAPGGQAGPSPAGVAVNALAATASSGPGAPLSASVNGAGVGSAPGPGPGQWAAGAADGQGGAFRLGAEGAGANAAKLVWAPVRGATSYAVYQAQGETPLAFLLSTGTTTTTLSGLAPGTTYRFQVRARNSFEQEIATSNTVDLALPQ